MGRMIFMLLYMIYMGFQTSNVNNAAHIGGLFGGILLTEIYVLNAKYGAARADRICVIPCQIFIQGIEQRSRRPAEKVKYQ